MKPEMWDDINNVGLRNHYFCTVYAGNEKIRFFLNKRYGIDILSF
jgi:hypothetical protein